MGVDGVYLGWATTALGKTRTFSILIDGDSYHTVLPTVRRCTSSRTTADRTHRRRETGAANGRGG